MAVAISEVLVDCVRVERERDNDAEPRGMLTGGELSTECALATSYTHAQVLHCTCTEDVPLASSSPQWPARRRGTLAVLGSEARSLHVPRVDLAWRLMVQLRVRRALSILQQFALATGQQPLAQLPAQ